MQALAGAAYSISFDIMQDGDYVVPDEGSVAYTLYDNTGAAVSGQTAVAVDSDATTNRVTIDIASGYNTIGSGRTFEQRTVRLSYKYQQKSYMVEDWYYVTSALNFRVSPMEVISALGIREGEVLANEVDLVQAYFKVADSVGSGFDTALSSGTISQIKANEAIKITAALSLARVIELKAFRKFGNELSYARFDGLDFEAIRANLKDALSDALGSLDGVTASAGSLFTVTTPVNPITG